MGGGWWGSLDSALGAVRAQRAGKHLQVRTAWAERSGGAFTGGGDPRQLLQKSLGEGLGMSRGRGQSRGGAEGGPVAGCGGPSCAHCEGGRGCGCVQAALEWAQRARHPTRPRAWRRAEMGRSGADAGSRITLTRPRGAPERREVRSARAVQPAGAGMGPGEALTGAGAAQGGGGGRARGTPVLLLALGPARPGASCRGSRAQAREPSSVRRLGSRQVQLRARLLHDAYLDSYPAQRLSLWGGHAPRPLAGRSPRAAGPTPTPPPLLGLRSAGWF